MDNENLKYVLSSELKSALKVAEITKRPLLIKGEPGTGKTLLAEYYAQTAGCDFYYWGVKSTTIAKDGLYFYDALTRLNDSRFSDSAGRDVNNIDDYIRYEPLGQAFQSERPAVLLIDEIDKADIEFPNDLLNELDRMEFRITETGKVVKAKRRPFVFITSNNEKELPDAFLRRCVFHYISFPDQDLMKEIVGVHFPQIDKKLLERAMQTFYSLRDVDDLSKKPSTSELIDWLQVLVSEGGFDGRDIPHIGALIKNEADLKKL